jgi:hypothetical protein
MKIKHIFLFFVILILMMSFVLLGFTRADEEDNTDRKRAVCNVSPNAAGEYGEDGCKKAFNSLPSGTLCGKDETATASSCVVNSDSCVNSDSKVGKWCTCTFTCEKNKNVLW